MQVHKVNDKVTEEDQFDMSKLGTCLDDLAATTTIEKDTLYRLVNNNENLVEELGALNKKDSILASVSGTSEKDFLNGAKIKFMQCDPSGNCHVRICKAAKVYSSKIHA